MDKNKERDIRKLDIKKYTNRRYYDTTHSRHLSLEEIRALVQQGYDIQVTDAKTSTDITRQVLTQIILELDKPKLDSFPVPLLLRVIRMNDDLVKDFIEKYFNQALGSFLNYQRQLEDQMRQTHALPTGIPSVADWAKAMLAPFTPPFTAKERNDESKADRAPAREDIARESDLRESIEQLKKEVQDLKRSRSKKKKRAVR